MTAACLYSIQIIDHGDISICIDGEWPADVEALHWAHFWLGRYRADAARLYRADINGNPIDLVAEIAPPTWLAERDRESAVGKD